MKIGTTRETFFLCANVGLIYVLGYNIYCLIFGSLGIIVYSFYYIYNIQKFQASLTLSTVRAFLGVILLSISFQYGILPFIDGSLLIFLYNLSWVHTAIKTQPIQRPFLFIIHLATNVGILLLAKLYEETNHICLFRICGEDVMTIIGSLGILINSTIAIIYQERYSAVYLTWRCSLMAILSIMSVITGSKSFAIVGVLCLLEFSMIALIYQNPDLRRYPLIITAQFIVITLAFSISTYLNLPYLFELSVVAICFIYKLIWQFIRPDTPKYAFVSLIVGQLVDSDLLRMFSFLIAAFWSLNRLKLKKANKVYPLLLLFSIVLGLLAWYRYGSQMELYNNVFRPITMAHPIFENVKDIIIKSSDILTWIFWPYRSVTLFQLKSDIILFILVGLFTCGIGFEISYIIKSEQPVDYDSPEEVEIKSYNIVFPTDTNDLGICLEVKGIKKNNIKVGKCKLEIFGDQFWAYIKEMLSEKELKIVEKSYPLVLTNNNMNIKSLNKSTDEWHGFIHLGTGLKKEKKIPNEIFKSFLKRLMMKNKPIELVVTCHNSSPKKTGVLFRISTTPSNILNNKKETDAKPYLDKLW